MKQIKKRISLMLAVCMIISMPMATASAETRTFDDAIINETAEPYAFMGKSTTAAAISGSMNIGGTTVSDLSQDTSGTGWNWDIVNSTLSLNKDYTGENIRISCANNDTINLEYSGNVTAESNSPSGSTIYCNGNLIVDGSGTLNVDYTGEGDWCAMEVMGELQITGGNLYAQSNGNTEFYDAVVIYGRKGVTISGSANVTATATGTDAYGIYTDSVGFITISTTGMVTANGTGKGYAISSGSANGKFNISNGTVILKHSNPAYYYYAKLNYTGGTLNGNTPDETSTYGVTVGGIEVTGKNCTNITGSAITAGTVSYDPYTKTLTLNNAYIAIDKKVETAIKVSSKIDNLTIELKGSSQIGGKPIEQSTNDYNIANGIIADNKVTVKGSGSLTIYDDLQGIVAKDITIDTTGTITISEHGEGGKACCMKAEGGTLEIKNGTLNLSSLVSNGLYGGRIIISGGTITAESFARGTEKNYAFNKVPEFASGYKYRVYAGEDKASAREITSPDAATFTQSNYVRIETISSGGGSKDTSGPAAPAVPTVPTPPAETAKKPVEQVLNDVGTHWALNSIQFIYDRGIMTGTSTEQFSPDAWMNRGMLITALGRLAGINELDFTSGSFNDVDMSSYYGPYAEWSLRSNITRGTGNNSFSPDNPVTREELAVILVNFATAMRYYLPSGEGAKSFTDNSTISPWAMEAIEIMRNANIMNGDTNNNFNPKAPATRAEIAAVLQRFIELMGI